MLSSSWRRRSVHGSVGLPWPLVNRVEVDLALGYVHVKAAAVGSVRVELHGKHWRELWPELHPVDHSGELSVYWGVFDIQLTPSAELAPWLKRVGSLVAKTRNTESEPDPTEGIRSDARAS